VPALPRGRHRLLKIAVLGRINPGVFFVQDVGPGLINSLKERIEQLSLNLERMKLAEYVELLNRPWRLFYINFMSGLARGLGIAVGFTVLSAVVLIVLQRLMVLNLPGVSSFIAEIVHLVQLQLKVRGI
jgi:hypothetical protein